MGGSAGRAPLGAITASLEWGWGGCVGKGVRGSPGGSGQGWVCGRGPVSALPPPAASLHGAHLQLCRIGPRHPPQHQQPRHRLLGPTGRSSSGPALMALLPSLCLSPCPQGFSARLRDLAGAAGAGVLPGAAAPELPRVPAVLCSCSSSASPRSSTRAGAVPCRAGGCTAPGWSGTRPSHTSPSTPRTPRTSCSTTPTCSASSTSPW